MWQLWAREKQSSLRFSLHLREDYRPISIPWRGKQAADIHGENFRHLTLPFRSVCRQPIIRVACPTHTAWRILKQGEAVRCGVPTAAMGTLEGKRPSLMQ